jgi:hypothetical protein
LSLKLFRKPHQQRKSGLEPGYTAKKKKKKEEEEKKKEKPETSISPQNGRY